MASVIGPGDKTEQLKVKIRERLQRLWPQIGDVNFDYVWNGYVGMSTDFMPRLHRLGPNASMAGPAATAAPLR